MAKPRAGKRLARGSVETRGATRPPARRPLVLVADDYDDGRAVYAESLPFYGFRVCEARTGLEAVEKAIDERPQVILMDLMMPVMDGWAAARQLKADPRTIDIPIVALTAAVIPEQEERARSEGFATLLTKPVFPEDLASFLKQLLGRSLR